MICIIDGADVTSMEGISCNYKRRKCGNMRPHKLFVLFMAFLIVMNTINNVTIHAEEQQLSDVSVIEDVQNEAYTTFAVVDITDMSIDELQQAVDDGYLTYEQIMLLYLDRIEAYAEMYECLTYVSDTAVEEARECDRIYRESGRTSRVFGLPVIVKDNIDVAGMPTTNGNSYMQNNIAEEDAEVIASLKDAGAIVLAKANMDRYAEHSQYSISDFGRVNNAFDLDKTSYGSSGGSAVSAAASLAPICIGTDTNASIRVPSSANGVVGIRPTKGLLSTGGMTTLIADRDTAGPMAKTVEDAAIILSAMTGFEQDYTLALDENALVGMRVGIVDPIANMATGSVDDMFDNAVALLEQNGAEIVHMSFSLASAYDCSVAGYSPVFASAMDRYDVDVVIYPTMWGNVLSHSSAVARSNSNGWYIPPSAGVPGISVPMGVDENGLPSGLEFAGRAYDDETVIAAAYAFEQALGLTLKTELAPNLYAAPEEIEKLFTLRDEGVCEEYTGFDEGAETYEQVVECYEAAVGYLATSYYDDEDAAERADSLMLCYYNAVCMYDAVYWGRNTEGLKWELFETKMKNAVMEIMH